MSATVPMPAIRDLNPMVGVYGSGPTGARCEHCVNLRTVTGKSRISADGRAHNSKPLTLFRCVKVSDEEPWSISFAACSEFQRAR